MQVQSHLTEFSALAREFDNLGLKPEKYPQLKAANDGMQSTLHIIHSFSDLNLLLLALLKQLGEFQAR